MTDVYLYLGEPNPADVRLRTVPPAAGYSLAVDAGAFVWAGSNASLREGFGIFVQPGAFLVNGIDAALKEGHRILPAAGAFLLTGTSAALLKGYRLSVTSGTFAIAGANAGLREGHGVFVADGAFAVTGLNADLIYTPVGSYALAADPGAFDVIGQPATFVYAPGSVDAVASLLPPRRFRPAPLERHYQVELAAGSFLCSGIAVSFGVQRVLRLASVSASVNHAPAALRMQRRLAAAPERSDSNQAAQLTRGLRLVATASRVTVAAPRCQFAIDGYPINPPTVTAVPDAIDQAWMDLQRDDEDALLLLGACDA